MPKNRRSRNSSPSQNTHCTSFPPEQSQSTSSVDNNVKRKECIFKSVQDIFQNQIDEDVIRLVLNEYSWDAVQAVDRLFLMVEHGREKSNKFEAIAFEFLQDTDDGSASAETGSGTLEEELPLLTDQIHLDEHEQDESTTTEKNILRAENQAPTHSVFNEPNSLSERTEIGYMLSEDISEENKSFDLPIDKVNKCSLHGNDNTPNTCVETENIQGGSPHILSNMVEEDSDKFSLNSKLSVNKICLSSSTSESSQVEVNQTGNVSSAYMSACSEVVQCEGCHDIEKQSCEITAGEHVTPKLAPVTSYSIPPDLFGSEGQVEGRVDADCSPVLDTCTGRKMKSSLSPDAPEFIPHFVNNVNVVKPVFLTPKGPTHTRKSPSFKQYCSQRPLNTMKNVSCHNFHSAPSSNIESFKSQTNEERENESVKQRETFAEVLEQRPTQKFFNRKARHSDVEASVLEKKDWQYIQKVKSCVEKNTPLLVILRGLPGSGKSHLAQQLKFSGKIFSTDNYFQNGKWYDYEKHKLSEAHEWNKVLVKEALQQNITPIIIDNTNIQKWEMKPYVSLGKKYGYRIEIWEPNTPWKFSIKELLKRNVHGVKKDSLKKMTEHYEHNINFNSVLSSEVNPILSKEDRGTSSSKCSTESEKTPKNTEGFPTEQASLCSERKEFNEENNHCQLSVSSPSNVHVHNKESTTSIETASNAVILNEPILKLSKEAEAVKDTVLEMILSHDSQNFSNEMSVGKLKEEVEAFLYFSALSEDDRNVMLTFINDKIDQISISMKYETTHHESNSVYKESQKLIHSDPWTNDSSNDSSKFVPSGQASPKNESIQYDQQLTCSSDTDPYWEYPKPKRQQEKSGTKVSSRLKYCSESSDSSPGIYDSKGELHHADSPSISVVMPSWDIPKPQREKSETNRKRHEHTEEAIQQIVIDQFPNCEITQEEALESFMIDKEPFVGSAQQLLKSKDNIDERQADKLSCLVADELSLKKSDSEDKVSNPNKKKGKSKMAAQFRRPIIGDKSEFLSEKWTIPSFDSLEPFTGNDIKCIPQEASASVMSVDKSTQLSIGELSYSLYTDVDDPCERLIGSSRSIQNDKEAQDNSNVSNYGSLQFDKGCMTDESLIVVDSDVEFLESCFPYISKTDLTDILHLCDNHVDGAVDALLEWGCDLPMNSNDRKMLTVGLTQSLSVDSPHKSEKTTTDIQTDRPLLTPDKLTDMCFQSLKLNSVTSPEIIEENIIRTALQRLQTIEDISMSRLNSIQADENSSAETNDHVLDLIMKNSIDVDDEQVLDVNGSSNQTYKIIASDFHSASTHLTDVPGSSTAGYGLKASRSVDAYRREESTDSRSSSNTCSTYSDLSENFQTKGVSPAALSDDDDDDYFTEDLMLNVSKALTHKLVELFGPINDSSEQLGTAIPIDLKTAKRIHNCLKTNARQKKIDGGHCFAQGKIVPGKLSDAKEHKSRRKNRRKRSPISSSPVKGIQHPLGFRVTEYNILPEHSSKAQSPVQLKDIMREEMARKTVADEMQKRVNASRDKKAISTRIKRQKLCEMFPGADEIVIDEIFEMTRFSLPDTISLLQGQFGNPVYSQHANINDFEENMNCVGDAINSMEPEDSNDGNCQDHFVDYRGEANLHHRLRQECFEKAQDAHQKGMNQVAYFYSQQANCHTKKMKKANMKAADLILRNQNLSESIDLHGLHVDEAIASLQRLLPKMEVEVQRKPGSRKNHVFIVTGKGSHSRGGKAKLRPSIMNYLKTKNYRYNEVHPGVFKVALKYRYPES